jgi:hypothetical protein
LEARALERIKEYHVHKEGNDTAAEHAAMAGWK